MLKRMRASDTGNLQTYLESRTEEIDSEIIVRVSAILQDVKTRRDDAVRNIHSSLTEFYWTVCAWSLPI